MDRDAGPCAFRSVEREFIPEKITAEADKFFQSD
jgi:hypothetical protein